MQSYQVSEELRKGRKRKTDCLLNLRMREQQSSRASYNQYPLYPKEGSPVFPDFQPSNNHRHVLSPDRTNGRNGSSTTTNDNGCIIVKA